MKKTIRLTESDLHNVIQEAVKKIVNEVDHSNFDFSRTPGIDLTDIDPGYNISPAEIKQKLLNLQNALKEVMDLTNGDMAGRNFSSEMFDKCYDFYNFIGQYMVELKSNCANYEGSWEEDHSDIPFIRKYGDDFEIPPYYTKDGNRVPDESFRQNFKKR